ncbi:MAG: redoxin domain-containing protein [Myxococcales bacterium]|nr:redoxin domain-containing protein [Myxococcales bacterium]
MSTIRLLPRSRALLCVMAFGLAVAPLACDGGKKADTKTDTKTAETKTETKQAETKEADAKQAEAHAPAAEAKLGELAPEFELNDLDGKPHKLADYKGKVVVLEWFNPGCPFVKHAHGEGPLKDMAKKVVSDDVAWLSINSGAPGKQGHGVEANKAAAAEWAMENPILLDESGEVGHKYGATNTPHIFIVDKEGKLAYAGAPDNAPVGEVKNEGEAFTDYIGPVLAALKDGKPVEQPETRAWGCSVKYDKV